MTNDFKKGVILGLSMKPLPVGTVINTGGGGGGGGGGDKDSGKGVYSSPEAEIYEQDIIEKVEFPPFTPDDYELMPEMINTIGNRIRSVSGGTGILNKTTYNEIHNQWTDRWDTLLEYVLRPSPESEFCVVIRANYIEYINQSGHGGELKNLEVYLTNNWEIGVLNPTKRYAMNISTQAGITFCSLKLAGDAFAFGIYSGSGFSGKNITTVVTTDEADEILAFDPFGWSSRTIFMGNRTGNFYRAYNSRGDTVNGMLRAEYYGHEYQGVAEWYKSLWDGENAQLSASVVNIPSFIGTGGIKNVYKLTSYGAETNIEDNWSIGKTLINIEGETFFLWFYRDSIPIFALRLPQDEEERSNE